jgi:hypothetical protein
MRAVMCCVVLGGVFLSGSVSQGAPTLVDPKIVGVWETQVKGGRWVWTVSPNGTYDFHSEAQDGMAPHSGTFSASAGHWWLRASNGQTDGGAYRNKNADSFVATGKAGTWAWKHPEPGASLGNDVMARILSGIASPGSASIGREAIGVIHCNPCDSSTVN